VFAISAPFRDEKHLTSGVVKRVSIGSILSDIRVDDDSLGAPLFNAAGEVVAITTPQDDASISDTRAVRMEEARGLIAAAEKKMAQTDAPSGAPLPVEPLREWPDDALKEAAAGKKGRPAPYRVAAEDFDVGLITPVLVYSAHRQEERTGNDRQSTETEASLRALQDFANWWDYVRNDPPVLMIRATPKLVEPFWKTVLRGAAQTQGVSLPPLKHIKAGFSRMRLFCGGVEVAPIHPFKIEQRVGTAEGVYEGFYVFDPGAIGPHCGAVTLTLFSDKAPDRGDTRVIDAAIVEQVWRDFAPYRGAAR
jgi:hypothetical protein